MTKDEIMAKITAVTPLIIAAFGIINGALKLKGLPAIEIGDDTITDLINSIATIVGTGWSWWKNNNWTKDAQTSQAVLNGLKDGFITTQEVNNFVDDPSVASDEPVMHTQEEVDEIVNRSEELDNQEDLEK